MNIAFPPSTRGPRRSILLALSLMLGLAAAGCGRNVTKAIALEAQADGMIAQGNKVVGAQLLVKALRYDSNDADRWVKLGRARRDLNQPAQAVVAFREAFDLEPSNIEAMQNLAVLFVSARKYDEAKEIVDPLLLLSPNDVAGVLATGAIAYYEERYPDAERIGDEMIKLMPESREGYVLKAHVLEKTGRQAAAARLLEGRLRINPDDGDLAEQLLKLYQSLGSIAGVRSISVRLTRLKPNDPRYRLESLRAYQADGDIAGRERTTAYLLKRYHANPSIVGAVADFWIRALGRDEAVRRTVELAARSDNDVKAALTGRLVAIGANGPARRLLEPIAGEPVDNRNTDLHAILAALLMAEGRLGDAQRQIDAVLAFDPGNDVALLTRARVALAQKHYAMALVDAQLLVSNDPGNEGASLLIADTYAAQGNDVLASAAYGDAQARNPASLAIARARTRWLIAKGRADEAAQVAGLFAVSTKRDDAWTLYEDTCRAAKDPVCLDLAKARGS